jgi:hypothetical protein
MTQQLRFKAQELRFKAQERATEKAYRFDGVWIPKSISTVEQLDKTDWRVWVPGWFVENNGLEKLVMPDEEPSWDEAAGDLCIRCGNPIDHGEPHLYCDDCS